MAPAVALTLAATSFGFATYSSAAECPAGTKPIANAAELKLAQATIPTAQMGMCWSATDATTGQSAGEAKQYLRSILCRATGNNFGGMGPDGTVNELDAKFAVCAAKFLKAASAQVGGAMPLLNGGANSVCVREGKRSVAKQEQYADEYRRGGGIACTKGANCEHPRGIAIDVNTSSEAGYKQLHAMAQQFGVDFYLRFKDKVHFVPARGGMNCSSGGTAPYDFGSSAPSSPLTQALRNFMRPTPAAAPSTQPSSGSSIQPSLGVAQMPTSCIPQFFCSGSTYYYKTSACVDQVYQVCKNGCADSTTCAPESGSATSSASTTQSASTSASQNTSTKASTSTYDQISSYANPQSTTTQTLAPITLNPGTVNAILLQPQQTPQGVVYVPVQPSNTLPVSDTFTSSDLSGSLPSQQQTEYGAVLTNVRNILLNLMTYLRPFGGVPRSQVYID